MWFDRSPWLSESEAGRACGELEDTDSGIAGRSFSFGCIRAGCTPKGTRRAGSVTNWMTHRTRLLLLQFYAANDICHARCTPAGTRRAGIVTKRVTEESPPSPLFFLYFYFFIFLFPIRFRHAWCTPTGSTMAGSVTNWMTEELPPSPSVLTRLDFHAWCTPAGTRRAGSVTNRMAHRNRPLISPLVVSR